MVWRRQRRVHTQILKHMAATNVRRASTSALAGGSGCRTVLLEVSSSDAGEADPDRIGRLLVGLPPAGPVHVGVVHLGGGAVLGVAVGEARGDVDRLILRVGR